MPASNLTPAQTAAMRAAYDGRDPFQAALEYHRERCRKARAAPSRYAAITIHSLQKVGYLELGGAGFDVHQATITQLGRNELPGADPETTLQTLLLVDVDPDLVTLDVVKSWSWDQRVEAEDWAIRVHLRASDNIIRVPPCPPHVQPYRETHRKPVQIGKFRV